MKPTQHTTTSKDGTVIAYEQTGSGPAVILVNAALADRTGSTKLAALLAEKFTCINYDRRGRGQSTDVQPYSPAREVEDIAALIDTVGGSASLFGQSSGAILALDAAAALGSKVHGLIMFEPPFVVDASRQPIPNELGAQAGELVKAGKPADAIKLFFGKVMGIPGFGVTIMKLVMPTWKNMLASAGTLPYDFAIAKGTQDGTPLPAKRWSGLTAPVLVMVGAKSEQYFHSGAKALDDLLPSAEYRSLPGVSHGSATMSPKSFIQVVFAFLQSH
ncbi:MAG TPA: alpha/beta hydrolase [Candidatus Saccharimonadales bacterium]|nr:alpha/beta hydrolase [Candidatus Saccharimonadales bacterium]